MCHELRRLGTRAGLRSVERERDDAVPALGVDLHGRAGRDYDVLLAGDAVGGRRRIDASASIECPQHLAVGRVIGAEAAIRLAREYDAAGSRQNAADHRLRRLDLPADLTGVVVDGGYVSGLLLARGAP